MQDKLKIVNSKIKEAESRGIIPVELYKEQLSILESAHSEFILKAQKAGYDLNSSVDILEVEVKQYSAMKQVAQKIGIDTKKYDNLIKEARIRVLGEDAVREYFSN